MGIVDDDVARVRDATDLVALAGEHIALKRVGQRYMGLCPFHQEKTPSFSINQEMGVYFCHGCQKSGDAITFIREVEHLDFVDAVERLAARAGITLRYDNVAISQDRKRKERLSAAVGAAIDFYHQRLLEAPDGGKARQYLRSRSFDGAAVRQFQLGYSPDEFDALSVHLQQSKHERNDIVDAGLAFVNKVNKLQDQFRGRLMFPIYDSRGEPVGFGGRALGDMAGPKYKNSPETPVYQKSRLLYGLNWAKGEIVARGSVIICEGYTDVMAFALADAPNSVATCGTALADEHFQILKNLARKVVLAYDADSAGQAAAERWYEWEQKFEVQVEVADLPAGRDPADVWRDDPAALTAAIERARPFLQFRLDRLLERADLSSLEGRARAGQAGVAIVGEHPNELVRDQYLMKLAGTLDIEVDRLREAVARGPVVTGRAAMSARGTIRASGAVEPARGPERPARPVDKRELDVLRWAIHRPEVVVEWLDASMFADELVAAAFEKLTSMSTFHEAIDSSEGPVRELLERLAVEEPPEEDDREPETLAARVMINAVEPAAQRVLAGMLRDGDDRGGDLKEQLSTLHHHRDVGDWDAAKNDVEQLLGWITMGPGRPVGGEQ